MSICDMDHLGFLRPLHHCFGGLLEAGQLQLSLADSHLEDPIQQRRGFLPAIRHVMFTQFCEATVKNMLYQHSTNQHSASWTEFYKSSQFCVNFTHLFTNHLLLRNGSKPCSPVVHIKIGVKWVLIKFIP